MDRNDLQDNGLLDHYPNLTVYTSCLCASKCVKIKNKNLALFCLEIFKEINLIQKFQKLY